MAKSIGKAVISKPQSAVAVSSVPAHLRGKGGVGLSTDARDNLVPLIYILQPLSPQVMKKNPAYIEGAEAGDIWLKGAVDPIVKGDEGINFCPCAFWKTHTEWKQREEGGGLVRIYENNPADDTPLGLPDDAEREEGGFNFVRENGNKIIANRNYAGLVFDHGKVPLPYVMILSSTGHTFARQWMATLNATLVDPTSGAKLPIWSRKWNLKTVHKQNNFGEWFMYGEPTAGDWVSEEEADTLERLSAAFVRGEKRAAMDQAEDEHSSSSGRSNEM